MIYDNPNCSQDDLVNIYSESKAKIAKSLKKLEDNGYIIRKVNPDNRRKYMLKTTPKGNELVPKLREITKKWQKEVGIDNDDHELIKKLKQIALNSKKLIEKEDI